MRVRPGPDGLAMFKAHLKAHLGISIGPEFDVTFECKMPATGSMVTLSGLNSYGAATHCAALLAASKAAGGGAATPGSPPPTQPCRGALLGSSSRGCDAGVRRRACQTGYLPTDPLPSPPVPVTVPVPWMGGLTAAGAGGDRDSPASSSSPSRPHASWRHLHQGADLEVRRARHRGDRCAGARSALGHVYGVVDNGSSLGADADDDATDELLPYGPREPISDNEDADAASVARAWTRRLEAGAGGRPASGLAAATAAEPQLRRRADRVVAVSSLRRTREASSGYTPSTMLRRSSWSVERNADRNAERNAVAPGRSSYEALFEQLPHVVPPTTAPVAAVPSAAQEDFRRGVDGGALPPIERVSPPSALAVLAGCPGAAPPQRAASVRAPVLPPSVSAEASSGRQQPPCDEPRQTPVKARLSSALKATAKRAAGSLLRALRHGKDRSRLASRDRG